MDRNGLSASSGKRDSIVTKALILLLSLLIALAPLYFLGIRGSFYYHYHQPDTLLPEAVDTETRELSPGVTAVQYFKPQGKHIASLFYYIVAVPGDPQDASLFVSISDQKGRILWTSDRKLTEVGNGVLYEDRVRVKGFPLHVDPGKIYTVTMSVHDCPGDQYPSLVLTGDAVSVQGLSGFSVIDGESVSESQPNRNIYLGYGYPREPSVWVILFSTLLALMLSFTLVRYFVIDRSFTFPGSLKAPVTAVLLVLWYLSAIPDIVSRLLGVSLDPSWRWFLNIAHERGYVFGRDVFFSYGPLGFVYYLMNADNPGTYRAGLVIWVILFAIHGFLFYRLYRVVRECRISAIAFVFAFLFYFCSFHESWTDNYILFLVTLSLVLFDRGDHTAAVPLNLLLCFSFFGKITGFIGGFAMVSLYAVLRAVTDRAQVKDRLKTLLLPLPAAVAMPVLYLAYSPSLSSLSGYLYNLYDNVSGFNQTQQMNDAYSAMDFRCFFLILIAYLLMIILFFIRDRRRFPMVLALGMPLFSAYKYGVTAHGMECSAWIAVMPLSALFLILPLWGVTEDAATPLTPKTVNRAFISVITACAVSVSVLFSLCSHGSLTEFKNNTKAKLYTASHINETTNDPALFTDYPLPDEILNEIQGHSVGIYPWNLAYGAEYTDMDLRFSPPVYDGEEVYNPWLDRMSAEYYRERGPEYIILQCLTVYDQVNFLNNPLIWEAMKDCYEAVWTDEDFCLLRRRTDPAAPAERELLKSVDYGTRDDIECPEGADYCVVHMDYSLKGKIKGLFWRYGVPTIHITYDDGRNDYGTILVPHMISGFSLDYLPKNTQEVSDMLNNGSPARMVSFRFGGQGAESMEDKITIDWYNSRSKQIQK